jgi:hypothetical protein
MSDYSKSAYAKSLGISTGELESKARDAGFKTTEEYYNSQGGSSGGMIDYNKIPSVSGYAQTLEQPITDAYNKYMTAMAARANPLDVYTQLESEAGIPGMKKTATTLREQIGGVEDTIKRVEPTIAATTKESMVTEGQRQNMAVAQKKPLLERLGEMTTGLGRIESGIQAGMQDISTKVSLYMQGQDQMLEPLKVGIQALTDKASRLVSAYSTDSQNKLQVLTANWERQNALDDRQYEEAYKLLEGENSYKKELQKAAASAGISLSGNEDTDKILQLIGDAAAEEISYNRAKTGDGYGSPTNVNSYYPSESGQEDWWSKYITP